MSISPARIAAERAREAAHRAKLVAEQQAAIAKMNPRSTLATPEWTKKSAYAAPTGATGTESPGAAFYLTIASIPLFYLTYQAATDNNFVNRFVEGYRSVKSKVDGNDGAVHRALLQEAVDFKFVLKSEPRGEAGPPVRYIEQLNAGSPMNVVAGEGSGDLSAVIQHQLEERRKHVEAREARLKQ